MAASRAPGVHSGLSPSACRPCALIGARGMAERDERRWVYIFNFLFCLMSKQRFLCSQLSMWGLFPSANIRLPGDCSPFLHFSASFKNPERAVGWCGVKNTALQRRPEFLYFWLFQQLPAGSLKIPLTPLSLSFLNWGLISLVFPADDRWSMVVLIQCLTFSVVRHQF